jgi:hypothetical protein
MDITKDIYILFYLILLFMLSSIHNIPVIPDYMVWNLDILKYILINTGFM